MREWYSTLPESTLSAKTTMSSGKWRFMSCCHGENEMNSDLVPISWSKSVRPHEEQERQTCVSMCMQWRYWRTHCQQQWGVKPHSCSEQYVRIYLCSYMHACMCMHVCFVLRLGKDMWLAVYCMCVLPVLVWPLGFISHFSSSIANTYVV